MPSVNDRIEMIFATAVALQQDGRFRSTIHCSGKMIHIMNQDMTVILRFPIRQYETEFKHPVSFSANDYDSKDFEEQDGKICFIKSDGDYTRVKSCKIPDSEGMDPRTLFHKIPLNKENRVGIKKGITGLLNDDLSHIEISCVDGQLQVVQRNIFSGAVIKIQKRDGRKGLIDDDSIADFAPMAMRTNDFMALFTFLNEIDFYFSPKGGFVYVRGESGKIKMDGIVSKCIYEEMKGAGHGRKK